MVPSVRYHVVTNAVLNMVPDMIPNMVPSNIPDLIRAWYAIWCLILNQFNNLGGLQAILLEGSVWGEEG